MRPLLWHEGSVSFVGVAVLAVVALPLAVATVWALARLRTSVGTAQAAAWRRSFAEVGIVYGTVPWVWLTLIPGSGAGVVPGRVSLVPLRDLETMSDVQIFGNLLILAAVGFCAPMLFGAVASMPRMLAIGVICSATIESAQYLLQLDRVSSVDDILLNATGAAVAAMASRPWWVTRARSDERSPSPTSTTSRRTSSDRRT
ncbi:MAG: VanZ family protein [Propionibacteriales bacterium]|nr:VanZ family protein [Propionibacteriales bacterium]